MLGQMSEFPTTRGKEFISMIKSVQNGFILSVNGYDFVIQGTGDVEDDFQSLVKALEQAYKKAVG